MNTITAADFAIELATDLEAAERSTDALRVRSALTAVRDGLATVQGGPQNARKAADISAKHAIFAVDTYRNAVTGIVSVANSDEYVRQARLAYLSFARSVALILREFAAGC